MLKYRIAFSRIKGMNTELAQKILEIIPTEQDFFTLPEKELTSSLGIKNRLLESGYRRKILDVAEKELEFIQHNSIKCTYYKDSDYPARFFDADDAPIMYFSKGNCNLNANKVISIVGTRNATPYGKNFCEKFISDIAKMYPDTIIVSGLAFGIDIYAHRAAIENSLSTVAVLAHGLNMIYPAQHRNNAIDIIKSNGMLLTDYTSQDSIHRANFLARNRIVAALADCTVVIESAEKGGALITANLAQGYNRDVFALPGRVTDNYSKGCNRLIYNNTATMITSADDLATAMRWEKTQSENKEISLFPVFTDEEEKIMTLLCKSESVHINALCASTGIQISRLMSLLVELEYKGCINALPGCNYSSR